MPVVTNLSDYYIRLLEALSYEGDKESYAQQCIFVSNTLTLFDLISLLDDETATTFKQQLAEATTAEDLEAIMRKVGERVSLDVVEQYSAKALLTQTEQIIDAVYPTLSESQQEKFDSYAHELLATNTSVA